MARAPTSVPRTEASCRAPGPVVFPCMDGIRSAPLCDGPIIPLATPEESPHAAGSVYGWTKSGQEQILGLLATATGLDCRVLRFQNVYGPGQSLRNPYTGVLMTFCNRALAGDPLILFEDGEITRDFVHVDDAVAALAVAGVRGRAPNGPINIGSGVPTTIRQAAESIRSAADSSSKVVVGGQFRMGDVRYAVADIRRAGEAFGFRPTVEFADGIGGSCPGSASRRRCATARRRRRGRWRFAGSSRSPHDRGRHRQLERAPASRLLSPGGVRPNAGRRTCDRCGQRFHGRVNGAPALAMAGGPGSRSRPERGRRRRKQRGDSRCARCRSPVHSAAQ